MIQVSQSVLEKYLNFEIDEEGLFPDNAPAGTRLEDLSPLNEDSAVCTLEHIQALFEKFIDEDITFEQFHNWMSSMLDLDLFVFDDARGENSLNWMFDTLDYLVSFEDEEEILDKVDFSTLVDKAQAFIDDMN
jgi:hypothetical protein